MLKIKLARFGKRGQPHYRIVVTEARSKRDGAYVENLGHYAPTQSPKILELNKERYEYWLSKGAQPTDTVASLFKRSQSKNPFPAKKAKPSKKQLAKKAEGDRQEAEESKQEADKESVISTEVEKSPEEKPAE